jgi:hypothetical protein
MRARGSMRRAWSIAVLLLAAVLVPLLFEERLDSPLGAPSRKVVARDPGAATPASPRPGAGRRAVFSPLAVPTGGAEVSPAPAARAADPGPALPGARLRGTLCDPAGQPIRGARITFGGTDAPLETVTGARGEYESPPLPDGPVPVFASHPDFQPRSGVAVIAAAGPEPARWDATLRPGERLTVRVTDAEGEPVPDAEVWLLRGGERAEGSSVAPAEWTFLGRTGDLGVLESRREPGPGAMVRARIAGYREDARPVTGSEVHIALAPAPALRGHAVDAAGLPVRLSGVRLEVLGEAGYVESPDRGRLFRSLAPGKFVVGLPPHTGTYRIAARAAGGLEGFSAGAVFDGTTALEPIVFTLAPRLEVRGSLRGPRGPLAGATVELLAVPPPEVRLVRSYGLIVPSPHQVIATVRADAAGRFAWTQIHAGSYRIRADGGPGLAREVTPPFAVPFDDEPALVLRPAASLAGTLFDPHGFPEAGAPIILVAGGVSTSIAWTDADGRFAFGDLPPEDDCWLAAGDRRQPAGEPIEPDALLAGGPALDNPGARRFSITEGKSLAFDLRREPSPLGSLEGAVLLDGVPAAGVVVSLSPIAAGAPPAEPAGARVDERSGVDGRFRFRGLEPGKYRVACAELAVAAEVEIAAGRRLRVDLETAAHRLRITLTDARTGEPYARRGEVELTRLASGDGRRFAAAGVGTVEVAGLLPGRYAVQVRARGYLHHQGEVEIADDLDRTVAIAEGEDVTVGLHVEDGEPFTGEAEVVLEKDGREVYRRIEILNGAVTVPTGGEGEYEVLVQSADRSARVAFEVRPAAAPVSEPAPSLTDED